jgi:single-strand DNA-binding protein
MAGETPLTIVGNLTADPELRYTQNGLPVVNLTIASTPRVFDRQANEFKDGETLFMRASAWREMAEHIAGSLTKGTRVVASGNLKQKSYETKEGEKRTTVELEIDEIGPSLRYATAQVTRSAGNQQGGQRGQAPAGPQQAGPQYPGAPQAPQQVAPQYAGPQQGYQQPYAGQPQPQQQGGFPDARTYQPPAQPGQYGDDTPF